ncbi:lung seven transmembrane receptor-domain-containing protein [Cyathus striatus]|nr:lung seven transmembrane receptor-domain-containing protein [Cyathus striatus]
MARPARPSYSPFLTLLLFPSLFFLSVVSAFQVPILDTDYSRQICSGMWGGGSTYINVTFDSSSQGQLAVVIYEWADAQYLGKPTQEVDEADEYQPPKVYVCTSNAVTSGYCTREQLGHFILDLPQGQSINDTSFWSARVQLPANNTSTRSGDVGVSAPPSSFWNNPEGNSTPSSDKYTSPWRRAFFSRDNLNPSPKDILNYNGPIHYIVRKTGYYCVAVIPVTVQQTSNLRAESDVPYHPSYKGLVLFRNKFDGQLPATDYPKVTVTAWGWLCYRHINELLPIQYYLSGLVALLVIEMVANWGNKLHVLLHVLVVSLGLSVVKESLGRLMRRCQLLALAHFVFGILYAIGIVELELESTSALVLLLFIIPLAFTLSGFLLWIMYALNATIAELRSRKQRYKLKMFERLYHILLFAVVVIAAFFVVSSLSFSGRLAEDYAAKSWRLRWWLLDGWLALLYFVAFALIAFLWRPSENNRRYDAEDYDLEALQHRTHTREDDEVTLVGSRRGGPETLAQDHVVFEIGDEDDDDDDGSKKRNQSERHSTENYRSEESERQGLMGQ